MSLVPSMFFKKILLRSLVQRVYAKIKAPKGHTASHITRLQEIYGLGFRVRGVNETRAEARTRMAGTRRRLRKSPWTRSCPKLSDGLVPVPCVHIAFLGVCGGGGTGGGGRGRGLGFRV